MAYADWLSALMAQRMAGNAQGTQSAEEQLKNLLRGMNARANQGQAGSGSGSLTSLGAPIPQTRWGDTIGSVNSTAGGPVRASDGVPYPSQSGGRFPNAIPISPNVPGFQPDRPHYIDGVPFPSQGGVHGRTIPNAPVDQTRFPIPGGTAGIVPPGWDVPATQQIVGGGGAGGQRGVYALAGSGGDPRLRLFELWLTSRFLPRQAM